MKRLVTLVIVSLALAIGTTSYAHKLLSAPAASQPSVTPTPDASALSS